MTRKAQDIVDDMRNIVKPRIAKMLLRANFEGRGKEDEAEFETEFEMILTLAEKTLEQQTCGDCISRQSVEEMIKAEMPERGMWEIEGDKEKETVCEVCVDLMQKLSELQPVTPQSKPGYISIDDAMSVFDDFMCGEVDEEGTYTFLEMLKDKAESEG